MPPWPFSRPVNARPRLRISPFREPAFGVPVQGIKGSHFEIHIGFPRHRRSFFSDGGPGGKRRHILEFYSCKMHGKITLAMKKPPAIKDMVATRDGHCNVERPIMA